MNALQHKIAHNVRRFDVCSLLKLLIEMGYQQDEVYFQCNGDLSSRSTLCEAIFFSDFVPKVTLVINIGLLSSNSPLPSFFRKKMDSGSIDPVFFARFLSFFDHHVIKNLMAMSMPDLNNVFFSSWKETQSHYLKLLDLNSTSTLWHIFQTCFPELLVQVTKSPRIFKQKTSSTVLGNSRLGENTFLGKKLDQSLPSFKCTLIGEETLTDLQVPWPLEVKRRLKTVIFALLQRTAIHFRVSLLIKNNKEIARLSPKSHVGYSRLGENKNALCLLLFSGYSKDLENLRGTS